MNYDFLPVSNGSGDAALMHVTADRLSGSATLEVDVLTNVPAKFIGTYGTLDPDGLITAASKRDFRGHISGSDIIIDAFEPGSTDDGNTIGQVVIVKPNTGWANRVAAFIKNMTNLGTPENVTVGDISAEDVSAENIAATGNAAIDGNATVGGNIDITGTSRLVPATAASADGSNNITPTKQRYSITALAAGATILQPTWAGQEGMSGVLKIKDNGTARALAWHANWIPIGLTLPTVTIAGKWLYVSYEYNSADSKWHVVGIARQA